MNIKTVTSQSVRRFIRPLTSKLINQHHEAFFLEKLAVSHLTRKFLAFMEPEIPLWFSQQPILANQLHNRPPLYYPPVSAEVPKSFPSFISTDQHKLTRFSTV
jgi:hypothetical protein